MWAYLLGGLLADIEARILKDIDIFKANIAKLDVKTLSPDEQKVVRLAEMYARDSASFMQKKDLYTSFSSIAYAHGLLDSILKLKHLSE